MSDVRCDARTHHLSERYLAFGIAMIRITLLDAVRDAAHFRTAAADIRDVVDVLELVASKGPVAECGWTGEVEDPDSWKCSQCRTWHTADEGEIEND